MVVFLVAVTRAVVSVTRGNSGITAEASILRICNLPLRSRVARLFSTVQVRHQLRKEAPQQGSRKAVRPHPLTL